MALALLVKSKCALNFTPLFANIARLSSSASILQCQNGSLNSKKSQWSNGTILSSPMLPANCNWNQIIGNKYVHRVTAADDKTFSHGHHDKLWTAERIMSLGLLGIVPIGIMFPSQPGDAVMALSMVMHAYWGLESVVTDYVRPLVFGTIVPKIAHGILILITASTLGGLFYFIYNDIGIGNAVHKLWAIKSQ